MTLLQSIYRFLSASTIDENIVLIYKECVSQARRPDFYQAGVPDTVEGRFDMILLHVYLVMRRMENNAEAKQQLFDLMFGDMDRSLRELGVGDMSIRKKMRPMISAFYGRGLAYEKAITESDVALSEVLMRNLFEGAEVSDKILNAMVAYVRNLIASLETIPISSLLEGKIQFVDPSLT